MPWVPNRVAPSLICSRMGDGILNNVREKEDHTSRRGALCVELTADVRQYLAETDAQLTSMYEGHYEDVTAAATLASCIDTAGMDALYAEACCGYGG